MQGDPSIFPMSLGPDVCCTGPLTRKDLSPDRAKLATVVNREKPLLFVKTPQKVKVVKPRTNVLTERSHFCLLIPVDVTGLGHTTLSIPHRVRSNVLSRASDDAVPAKVFLAPMSVVPGAAHTQRPIA